MELLYLLVAMMTTTIGAIAGIGGGVIIKPVLDLLGHYSISTISVLSAFTVFSMAIVSLMKQIGYKTKIEIRKTVYIGFGSIIGGILGDRSLSLIIDLVKNDGKVTFIQNLLLAISLILVYVYMNNKEKMVSYKVNSAIACILIGVFLGCISSFLSIGGGPINVCVLTLFFSMNTKVAAVNSIITILFSQAPKLIMAISGIKAGDYVLTMLPWMIIGGILGGILGSRLNSKLTSDKILSLLNIVIISLVTLNTYNIVIAIL